MRQEHIGEILSAADSVAYSTDTLPERGIEPYPHPRFFPVYMPEENVASPSFDLFIPAGSASEVFGTRSRLEFASVPAERQFPNPEKQRLNYLLLDGLTILLFFFFGIHLFRHRASIGLLFRSLFVPGQFDSLVEDQSVSFRTFIRSSYLLGLLSLLAIGFKWSLIWAGSPAAIHLPDEWESFLLPILTGVLLAVLIYKRTISEIIAVLSDKHSQTENIRHFNRFYIALASHFLAPLAILTGLADPERYHWLFVVQVIVLIILILYYLVKSFSFFVSRKISILQWILYLCAVETLPVSFFVLFALRGFEW